MPATRPGFFSDAGQLGDAERGRVRGDHARSGAPALDLGEQRSFRSMRSGAASITKSASRERLRETGGRDSRCQHRVRVGRAGPSPARRPCATMLLDRRAPLFDGASVDVVERVS